MSTTIPAGPTFGPCEPWTDPEAIVAACPEDCCTSSLDVAQLTELADEASAILFRVAGRLYGGVCERTVRPCRSGCGCWSGRSGAWAWRSEYGGLPGYGGFSWACGDDRCGCGSESYIRLAGYPVRQILEVLIDGTVVPPEEYRLDGYRDLLRLADPGPPVVRRAWPACQNLALDDSQPGTFSIRYQYGNDVPSLGKDAATYLACQLGEAKFGGNCKLPTNVSRVVRQGITMERVTTVASLLLAGATGIPLLDMFLASASIQGTRRRPAVWSPDVPELPRRIG